MAKQVLLLQDVLDLGRKGDVCTVKEGYAYNYLLPQRFAMLASKHALRQQERLQEERRKLAAKDLKEAESIKECLKDELFAFAVKVDHEGHMYGSVSASNIIEHIKAQTGIELDKKVIQMQHPIKQTGAYTLSLRLKEGVTSEVHVRVMSEEQAAEHEAAERDEESN